jgi:hypothetical protein
LEYCQGVIVDALELSPAEVQVRTGWELKPEGACKDDRCVPMDGLAVRDGKVDLVDFAGRLGMPIAHDAQHGLWALGPQNGGHVLESVHFPDLVLSDFDGKPFDFAALRGKKSLLIAWASY